MADTRCDWVRLELAEVRRGRASADVADRVTAHLAQCAACQAEADWDARLGGMLVNTDTPRGAEERVQRLRYRRRWLQRSSLGVAAAALIGVTALALFDFKPRQVTVVSAPPTEAKVMKELSGVVAASPVVRLQVDHQQALLLAELTLLAQGDKR